MLGLLLLMGSTILTLSSVRVGIMEQRIANNEIRAKEAQQAAQAGLDYALAVLSAGGEITEDTDVPVLNATNDYTYDIYFRPPPVVDPDRICVSSTAEASSDASIRAMRASAFSSNGCSRAEPGPTMRRSFSMDACTA
jgi:Tfp pilus assembly protein PilX